MIEFFLKEAFKNKHFLNVFRPRIRAECFPKRQNSNLTKFMNVLRLVLRFSYSSTFPPFSTLRTHFLNSKDTAPIPKMLKRILYLGAQSKI